jgi:hypothetical protein
MHTIPTNATNFARKATLAAVVTALAALSPGPDAGYAAQSHHASAKPSFSLGSAPGHAAVIAGSAAVYKISIRRAHFAARVTLKITSKLPKGASARLSVKSIRRSSSTLTVTTSRGMAPGSYRLKLRATAGKLTRSTSLTLSVAILRNNGQTPIGTAPTGVASSGASGTGAGTANVQSPPFTIVGNAGSPLEPGAGVPIDLQISNPNNSPLVLTGLTAGVRTLIAPAATASLPCTLADFSVQQYSGSLALTVPASSTRSLAQLGVPSAKWPQISIIDRPTNQDGCKGASLTLAYGGAAKLG